MYALRPYACTPHIHQNIINSTRDIRVILLPLYTSKTAVIHSFLFLIDNNVENTRSATDIMERGGVV